MFPSSLVLLSTSDSVIADEDIVEQLTGVGVVVDGLTPLDDCRILGLTYKKWRQVFMKIHGGDDIYTFKGFESSNIVICDRKSKSLLLK